MNKVINILAPTGCLADLFSGSSISLQLQQPKTEYIHVYLKKSSARVWNLLPAVLCPQEPLSFLTQSNFPNATI